MLPFPNTAPRADHSQERIHTARALHCCECLWCILATQPNLTPVFRLGSEDSFHFRTDLWRDADVFSALLCATEHDLLSGSLEATVSLGSGALTCNCTTSPYVL